MMPECLMVLELLFLRGAAGTDAAAADAAAGVWHLMPLPLLLRLL